MSEISTTTVKLGYVIKNRGEYISEPETRYYKDNVVQYEGSSFIADPVGYDRVTNPLAYVTVAPYDVDPNHLNEGWKVFASDAAYVNSFMFFTENPEWAYAVCDSEDKILFGVKQDGEFYFGAGCPPQVKSYIEEKISALSLDEYEAIVAFMDGLENEDKTLRAILEEVNASIEIKVDKEEGKSLIDSEYASTKSTIDSPEFLDVTLDVEDKILEGLKKDGTKVIGGDLNVGSSASVGGDLKVLGNMEVSGVSYKVIESPEYLAAWVDASDKIIFGLKVDGKTFIGDADFLNEIKNNQEAINEIKSTLASIGSTIESLDINALSSITTVENPEFIETKIDSEGKLLAGRTPDGVAFENVGFETPKVSTESVNIDGHTIENIEDLEGRSEITTDSEGKIISYRDADGVKHEEVGFKTNNLEANNLKLSAEGLTDLEKALKENGFSGGQGDWSDYVSEDGDKPLHLSEPRCAILNILSDFNLSQLSKEGRPEAQEGVNYNIPIEVQFWDMQGNYFKKPCLVSGQGNSSFGYAKRNLALDFFDTSVYDAKDKLGEGDAFAIKFGNWVAQDSYHLKAFYTDFLRGASICAYKISDQVELSRGIYKDRPWKRGLLSKHTFGSDQITSEQIDDMSLQIDNNARCMPDAFPVIVYQNGSFWGVYAWCIKKHRDNYHMNKSTAENIHLDGSIGDVAFLHSFPYAWVEVRNPKSLYADDGSDYAEGKSLATPELVSQWITAGVLPDGTEITSKIKKNLQLTAKVWGYIDNIHIHFHEVKDAAQVYESSSKTAEDLAAFKAVFETYFDAENLIDYEVVQLAVDDPDGFAKNWQWVTYDGIKWYVCEYDKDMSFGNMFNGVTTRKVKTQAAFMGDDNTPIEFIKKYYATEVKARWDELKSLGILTTDNFISIINSWIERIGKDNYEKEWQKWPYSPCNRDRNDYIDSHWKLLDYTSSVPTGYVEYNEETEYHVGDTCYVDDTGYGFYWVYECIENSVGNNPMISIPQRGEPIRHGYRDSLWRFREFIDANLALYNEWFNEN